MDRTVGIIGAGGWGTTLAKIVAENGRAVRLWAREAEVVASINHERENTLFLPGVKLPAPITAVTELGEVARACRLLFVVVPSHGFRQVVSALGESLDGEHVVIHGTKGLEQETHRRMSEILGEETCLRKVGVLAGPNLSRELTERKPAGTLIASRYHEVYERAHAVLSNDYFRIYSGRDVIGAEVGGFFKNIVAVAAGAVDGLGLGDNTKALLLTRGMTEMARFGITMGAERMTFFGLAGFGDLMATCDSPFSRNHQVGERIARGESRETIEADMKAVAEGVKTAKAVHSYAKRLGLDLPIVTAVYRVLYAGVSLSEALADLMARQTGDELAGLS